MMENIWKKLLLHCKFSVFFWCQQLVTRKIRAPSALWFPFSLHFYCHTVARGNVLHNLKLHKSPSSIHWLQVCRWARYALVGCGGKHKTPFNSCLLSLSPPCNGMDVIEVERTTKPCTSFLPHIYIHTHTYTYQWCRNRWEASVPVDANGRRTRIRRAKRSHGWWARKHRAC